MLFALLLKERTGDVKERFVRRAEWKYPKGMRRVAEYWLFASPPDPTVISIVESESIAPIMATLAEWNDEFHITVVPVVTAEEGMKLAAQMMPGSH